MTPSAKAEPPIRLPWPVLALLLAILLCRAAQSLAGDPDWIYAAFGLTPAAFFSGRWAGVVTSLFVHGGWAHVLLNALGLAAFGPPVARLFGAGAFGRMTFFGFYLLCGAVAAAGFCLVRIGQAGVLIGASGAIAGLMGAASRLLAVPGEGRANAQPNPWDRRARLAPFSSRTVLAMAAAWVAINGLLAFGAIDIGSGGQPIAWEAHLAGYAAGLLLVGPVARLLGRA